MEETCIFCQIVKGERPAEFLYRGANVVAFKDIHPHAPVHVLLVPTRHIRSVNDLADDDRATVAEMIWRAREVAGEMGISRSGYKLVFNVERGGGQYVFHLHLHLLGGWERDPKESKKR